MGIDVSDLSEEEIEAVVNSRGFQKMLGYNRLADGIEVLEDEDEIYDSLVTAITKQHKNNLSESSVRIVLELFRQEVQTFTEPLASEGNEDVDADDLEDAFIDDG